MPFSCSICVEESTRICVRCTKDACDNHLCEKCRKCSDCCECEVALSPNPPETVREALHAATAQAEPIVEAVAAEMSPLVETTVEPVVESTSAVEIPVAMETTVVVEVEAAPPVAETTAAVAVEASPLTETVTEAVAATETPVDAPLVSPVTDEPAAETPQATVETPAEPVETAQGSDGPDIAVSSVHRRPEDDEPPIS